MSYWILERRFSPDLQYFAHCISRGTVFCSRLSFKGYFYCESPCKIETVFLAQKTDLLLSSKRKMFTSRPKVRQFYLLFILKDFNCDANHWYTTSPCTTPNYPSGIWGARKNQCKHEACAALPLYLK